MELVIAYVVIGILVFVASSYIALRYFTSIDVLKDDTIGELESTYVFAFFIGLLWPVTVPVMLVLGFMHILYIRIVDFVTKKRLREDVDK